MCTQLHIAFRIIAGSYVLWACSGGVGGHSHGADVGPPPGTDVVIGKPHNGDVEVASEYANDIALEKVCLVVPTHCQLLMAAS